MTASPATNRVISSSPTFGRYSEEPLELLRAAGCSVQLIDRGDTHALMQALPDATAWIAGFEPVDETTLAHAPNIKVVAKCGAGMDNFDLRYLKERGIATVNVPGGNARPVAEYTVGQIVALARGILANDQSVRAGKWGPTIGRGLDGRTLGIVGFGAIGQEVAKLATVFGMSVIVTDPLVGQAALDAHSVQAVALDELLEKADVVSIHVPLAETTRNLIGEAELAMMAPHALLINNSRGGILDERALAAALTAGTIAGAALDVFEQEPLPKDSPLLSVPRLVLSSHTAGYSDSALAVVTRRCAESVLETLKATH
ncbi:phosphoglycerate dehydrogenase [Micromonospora sp. NBC_01638]|uniref:phosphoglycerate dehydrogenase n=1 Tax=Micromonospora sp. NBC_01638 TaxID=2975982 RepID=UPI00386D9BAC|nr:phosphoglycerate dehydrogenase [Micromonospora sp. NBC_01638]